MNSRKAALLIILFFWFLGCAESEQELTLRPFARVETTGVSNITSDGVLLSGRVTFTTVGIDDHGFILSSNATFSDGATVKFSVGPRTGTGSFEHRVETQLEEGIKYFVKSYAKSKAYTSFGNVEEFVSLGSKAPVLASFEPHNGVWGDKVTIKGSNFAVTTGGTEVFFEDVKAEIVSIGLDSIVCRVPNGLRVSPATVKVVVLKNSVQSSDRFSLRTPEITSISPSEARWGGRITVNGKYFGSRTLHVMLGETTIAVSAPTPEQFKFDVPWGLSEGEIELRVYTAEGNGFGKTTIQSFPAGIGAITPLNGTYGQPVDIELRNWPLTLSPSVKFGTYICQIVERNATKLTVLVPAALSSFENEIRVSAANNEINTGKFFILDPPVITGVSGKMLFVDDFIDINGAGFSQYHTSVKLGGRPVSHSVISNNEISAHIVIGEKHQEPLSVESSGQAVQNTVMLNFPFCYVNSSVTLDRLAMVVPSSGGAFFIHQSGGSTSSLSWWNRTTKTWVNHGATPIVFNSMDFGFVAAGNLFVISSESGSLWSYNLSSNTWSQRNNVPFVLQRARTFFANNTAYVVGGYTDIGTESDELWQYDLNNDTWIKRAPCPGFPSSGVVGNGQYYAVVDDFEIGVYDPIANEWTISPGSTIPGLATMLSYRNGFLYLDTSVQLARYDLSNGEVKVYELPYLTIFEPVPMGASAIFFNESLKLMEFDPAYLVP